MGRTDASCVALMTTGVARPAVTQTADRFRVRKADAPWAVARATAKTRLNCSPESVRTCLPLLNPEPRMQRLLTVWWWFRCRWTGYHHWHDGRCTVCGIGVYGRAEPMSAPPTHPGIGGASSRPGRRANCPTT